MKTTNKLFKIFCLSGNSFLIIMALFHGSGYFYVTNAITASNSEDFLKDIVPVLFAHPTIHLLGLAALGFLALSFSTDAKKLLTSLSILVFIDALLAFYLGGWIPGILLTIISICFIMASIYHKKAFNMH